MAIKWIKQQKHQGPLNFALLGRRKEEREKGDARILGSGDFVVQALKGANELRERSIKSRISLTELIKRVRVRQKISSQFQVLRRSADKARKSMNIKHIQNFRNAVRRDASAPEM